MTILCLKEHESLEFPAAFRHPPELSVGMAEDAGAVPTTPPARPSNLQLLEETPPKTSATPAVPTLAELQIIAKRKVALPNVKCNLCF